MFLYSYVNIVLLSYTLLGIKFLVAMLLQFFEDAYFKGFVYSSSLVDNANW